ncbi:MAG: hypothetical protein ACK55Z_08460 [bacterium]
MSLAYITQNTILHENVGALKCRRPKMSATQNVGALKCRCPKMSASMKMSALMKYSKFKKQLRLTQIILSPQIYAPT